ncbi:MAG: transposase [Flavobacteriaceae bacterium]|nr:transposase [Flavobacteriaceae bacterium]
MKKTHIQIRYRIRTSPSNYRWLHQVAGANRHLWNQALEKIEKQYQETKQSNFSFFSLCRWYVIYKNQTAPWLKNYPKSITRVMLKDVSDAYRAFVTKKRGKPRYKSKHRNRPSIPIEINHQFKTKEEGIYFRMKKGHDIKLIHYHKQLKRYQNFIFKSGRIVQSITGKWYLTVCYQVDAMEQKEDGLGIGIDRNVGQVADHQGQLYHLTNTDSIQKRIKYWQRKKARQKKGSRRSYKTQLTINRHYEKIKHIKKNDLIHIANQITTKSRSVVMEDLRTKGMTASARGTVDQPGKNVKQKSGLNRAILGTGWYQLEQHLSARGVIHKINPAYTSQTCSCCGYVSKHNRLSQSRFVCQQCGYTENADVNAAKNIWASGMGTMLKNGRGVFVRPIISNHGYEGRNTLKCQSDSNNHSINNGYESI